MEYLSADEILLIHSMIVDETGGAHGVRDRHAILSVVAMPRQSFSDRETHPSIFEKAAVYARGIIMDHPFVDGNKRTGVVAASIFLENNGYQFVAEQGEMTEFAVRIVTEKLEVKEIAEWLEEHTDRGGA